MQRAADGTVLESVLFNPPDQARRGDRHDRLGVRRDRAPPGRGAHGLYARHDELTGLANRTHCREQLNAMLAAADEGSEFTLAMVDLDHFKDVNDTYGTSRATRCWPRPRGGWRCWSRMTRCCAASAATNSRSCSPGTDRKDVKSLCKAVIAALSKPFFVGEHVLRIGATIGLAAAPQTARTRRLCCAMPISRSMRPRRASAARCAGSSPRSTSPRRNAPSSRTIIRNAVLKGELEVNYQPLINLETEEIDGYEATAALAPCRARLGLARSVHPAGRGNGDHRHRRPARAAHRLCGSRQNGRRNTSSRSTSRRCSSATAICSIR